MHYQPIVDLREGKVSSFESLMRWKHPSRGMIAPSEFIPIAEETRLIVRMGSWALKQACTDAMDWPDDTKVAVNLSAVQIECCDVYEIVTAALSETGLAPQRLQLEITETVLMRDQTRTQEVLRKLHDLGVLITLDDFGTCFATLNYLRSFPFKKIKIDRSFVRDIPEHHDCVAIVKSVADLARELNMRSVAEGVETVGQSHGRAGCRIRRGAGLLFQPAGARQRRQARGETVHPAACRGRIPRAPQATRPPKSAADPPQASTATRLFTSFGMPKCSK